MTTPTAQQRTPGWFSPADCRLDDFRVWVPETRTPPLTSVSAVVAAGVITSVGLRFGYLVARHLVAGLALLGRSESAKDVEILVLRHQLVVLLRQVGRPPAVVDGPGRDCPLAMRLPPARRVGMIVTPGDDPAMAPPTGRMTVDDTESSWPAAASGRGAGVGETMGGGEPDWGYRRIQGELWSSPRT